MRVLSFCTGIEESDDKRKVRCTACKDEDPTGFGQWINCKSLKKHLDSPSHHNHIFCREARHREQEVLKIHQKHTYGVPGICLDNDIQDPMPKPIHSLFHKAEMTQLLSDSITDPMPIYEAEDKIPQLLKPKNHTCSLEEEHKLLHNQYLSLLQKALDYQGDNSLDLENETEMAEAYLSDELQALSMSILVLLCLITKL